MRIPTTITTLIILFLPTLVGAEPLVPCDGATGNACQACHFAELGQNILTWLIGIMAAIIALVFVIGGLKMVTAAGDTSKITSARSMMTNALIGFVILLSSWLIIDTIIKTFVEDDFLGELGPWHTIQCEDQPELIERVPDVEGGGGSYIGSNIPFNTEVGPTSLQDTSFESVWNKPLSPSSPYYGNTNIWNHNPQGTSIPIVVPHLSSDHMLKITRVENTTSEGAVYGVLSGTRDFNSPFIDDYTWGLGGGIYAILTPEDSGRVLYLNYRGKSGETVSGDNWMSTFQMHLRKTSLQPDQEIPLPPMTPLNGLEVRKEQWKNLFKVEWPNPYSRTIADDIVGIDNILSIEFKTDSNSSRIGGVGSIEYGGTRGARLLAISRYPGDFQVSPECKSIQNVSGWLVWRIGDSTVNSDVCILKPNTTYYWNITFTDGLNAGTSRCTVSPCGLWLKVSNPD